MRNLLRKKLSQLLEHQSQEGNIDNIIDEMVEYVWRLSRYPRLLHGDYEQLNRIESKLDQIIENRNSVGGCRFTEEDGDSFIQLITGVGTDERNKAANYLSQKLEGAKSLTICDPYFLKKSKELTSCQTAMQFIDILPKSLRSIDIYTKPRIRDKEFAECLNNELKKKEVKLISRKTEKIHDRV